MPAAGIERGPEKTNVTRLLESRGIAHRVVTYEVDLSDLSATHAAEKVGLPAEQVFKTLALRGPKNGVFLCCIPGDAAVSLKKAAAASGEKSVEMLPLKDLTAATGYVRGGCSPIGTKRAYPVYIDETAQLFDEVSVSAGARGSQIVLAPGDLVAALEGRASCADLT
jgi:Cys-tRNA(Pro)/Cys-tRNA(Cys) deacylase